MISLPACLCVCQGSHCDTAGTDRTLKQRAQESETERGGREMGGGVERRRKRRG